MDITRLGFIKVPTKNFYSDSLVRFDWGGGQNSFWKCQNEEVTRMIIGFKERVYQMDKRQNVSDLKFEVFLSLERSERMVT